MRTTIRLVIGLTMVWLVASSLAGCSRSPRVTYYTLEAAAAPESAPTGAATFRVVVGPVTLPEMVDRPQLVVRAGANQVDILEMQRWAEPLKSGIARLMAEDLSRQLRSAQVVAYPRTTGGEGEFQVLVDIRRFEATPGKGVTVDALWSVRQGSGIQKTGRSVATETAADESYDALVAAQSRALAAVSREIAGALPAEAAVPR